MTDDAVTPDPFSTLLVDLRGGEALNDASAALAKLVGDIRATGKGGSITLTLEIAPVTKGNTTTLVVVDAIKVKPPRIDPGSTIVFADEENHLSRRDPRQPELPTMERGQIREFPRDAAAENQ